MKKILGNEKGAVAIIIAVGLVALMLAVAMTIDVGSLFEERRLLQTVADSAALAGAQELPENPDEAIQKAIDYANNNYGENVDSIDVEISFTLATDDTITVTVLNPDAPLYFARVTGKDSTPVGAQARAMIAKPLEVRKVVPWGIDEDSFKVLSFEDPAQFYFDTIDEIGPGNFGCLDLPRKEKGGGGANDYYDNILYGYNNNLKIEDKIDTKPGKMPEKTDEYVYERINILGDGKDEFGDIVFEYPSIKNDTQVVYIPVISVEEIHGKTEVTIRAFAIFVITDWGKDGKEAYVKGQFIEKAITNSDGGIGAVEDLGLRVIRLIK